MGFFDLFKRKATEEVAADKTESTQEAAKEAAKGATTEATAEATAEVTQEPVKELEQGLAKTKSGLFDKITRAVAGRSTIDADVLDDLEEVLITSDVGVETTVKIIEAIEARVARDKDLGTGELKGILRAEIAKLLEQASASTENFGIEVTPGTPYVLMVVGVNGVGKTTTIGKLAAKLTAQGHKVYIGAADTFRAAAIDQLGVWADRAVLRWCVRRWAPIPLRWRSTP